MRRNGTGRLVRLADLTQRVHHVLALRHGHAQPCSGQALGRLRLLIALVIRHALTLDVSAASRKSERESSLYCLPENHGHIGGALLTAVAAFAVAAVIKAAERGVGWNDPLVIGLLCAAGLCLFGALWAFGAWAALRRAWMRPEQERRELLTMAQKTKTELETCRYRLSEAKTEQRGWFQERQLPADIYNAQWASSPLTADEVAINEALRGFYVWADEMNGKMSRRAAAEYSAVGTVQFDEQPTDLDAEAIAELDEGLGRVKNALEHLEPLIQRLTRPRRRA